LKQLIPQCGSYYYHKDRANGVRFYSKVTQSQYGIGVVNWYGEGLELGKEQE